MYVYSIGYLFLLSFFLSFQDFVSDCCWWWVSLVYSGDLFLKRVIAANAAVDDVGVGVRCLLLLMLVAILVIVVLLIASRRER